MIALSGFLYMYTLCIPFYYFNTCFTYPKKEKEKKLGCSLDMRACYVTCIGEYIFLKWFLNVIHQCIHYKLCPFLNTKLNISQS